MRVCNLQCLFQLRNDGASAVISNDISLIFPSGDGETDLLSVKFSMMLNLLFFSMPFLGFIHPSTSRLTHKGFYSGQLG